MDKLRHTTGHGRTSARLAVVAPLTLLFVGTAGVAGAYAAPSPTGETHVAVAGDNANGGVGNGTGNGNTEHAGTTSDTTTTTPAASDTASDHGTTGTAGTVGDTGQPQPSSGADTNSGGANGQCTDPAATGPYCSTRGDGTGVAQPSGNGKGDGQAVGKPCAGCVGKADNKNPKGQMPNGTDPNAGYECDRNQGIGQTNPAHTGCTVPTTPTTPTTPIAPVTPPTTGTTTGTTSGPGTVSLAGAVGAPGTPTTQVLGERQTRTPGSTPSVLGKKVTRTPQLPFTGAAVTELALAAGVALSAGTGLLVAGRTRRRPQH